MSFLELNRVDEKNSPTCIIFPFDVGLKVAPTLEEIPLTVVPAKTWAENRTDEENEREEICLRDRRLVSFVQLSFSHFLLSSLRAGMAKKK